MINDSYGHDVGDSVLEDITKLCKKQNIRETDSLGRSGWR